MMQSGRVLGVVLVALCAGLAACGDGSGAVADRDVGQVDVGTDTQDGEKNACGGVAVLDQVPGDACGPCGLDVVQCDGVDAVVCDGATACPDILVETVGVEDVGTGGATFFGVAKAPPGEAVGDHGFCISRGADEEVCRSLGGLTESESFSFVEIGMLPGRKYGVRAFATVGAETVYGGTVEFTTLAVGVTGFAASAGEFVEHVQLRWEAVEGVETYVLYRDGQEIARVGSEASEYLDVEAAAGSAPSAVSDVVASQGDFVDHVLVTWEPATLLAGDAHSYQMLAEYPDVASEKTAGVEGYRKAFEVEGYEISVDGAAFVDVGPLLKYKDLDAAAAEITAGEISASNGTFAAHVALKLEEPHSVDTVETTYVVRAVSTQEVGGQPVVGAESAGVSGYRGVGEVALQWEHSSNETYYTSISGATTPTFNHTGAYSDGTPRFYRARFSASGAETVYSEVVQGARAVLSVRFVSIPSEADINQPFGTEIEVTNQFDVPFGGVEVRMMLARDTVPFFAKTFGSQTTDVQGRAVYVHAAPVTWPGMDFLFEAKLPNNKMFYSEQFRVDRAPVVVASSDSSAVAGDGKSVEPALSADGRYVVFASTSGNLVAGNVPSSQQIYRKDLMEGTVKSVSISKNGVVGNGSSYRASVSANGRFVAFVSNAKNLLSTPVSEHASQIFLKDMETGDVLHVSTTKTGVVSDKNTFTPAISADGRFVAFGSNATNLASGILSDQINHIYRKDRQSGELEIVTRVVGQAAAEWASFEPAISADGSKIAFASFATNLVPGLPNAPDHQRVFVRDMNVGGGFTLVSSNESGISADDTSRAPSISGDGRYVTYLSSAKNFANNPNAAGHAHIYRRDLVSGAIDYVSTNVSGEVADNRSVKPAMSADGRFVTFGSYATNLLAGVQIYQIYRKDLLSGRVDLVSSNMNGEAAIGQEEAINSFNDFPAISADGRYVGFSSAATNLVVGVTATDQVYVRRLGGF